MQFRREGYPSGQREQTVNLPALPSKVRILPPPPSESGIRGDGFVDSSYLSRGCSSMVEQKPSKLTTRVRFPSPAPRLGGCRTENSRRGEDEYSALRWDQAGRSRGACNQASRPKTKFCAHVAQW